MTEHESAPGTLCFGPFQVDVERRLLRRGAEVLAIGSRAMDILLVFLAQPGSLVSTRELLESAWPRSMGADANLRAQIFALRRILGDGEGAQDFIQNVPGRGYRFIAPVENRASMGKTVPSQVRRPKILGRDDTVSSILARLPQRRLLTIAGPGGIGKTTVARAVAAAFGPTCTDGVRWVDLSGAKGDQSAPEAIAVALGLINFTSDHSPAVISWLKDKRLLLVMDCCDRVVGSVAALAERILRETTGVNVLVTSRESLRAAGEQVVRLPPLSVPTDAGNLRADEAMLYPAIQLFVERAAHVRGGFTLRDEDVPHVVRICSGLDGIALAIELAAGHLVAIELRNLASLLDDKFRLLPVGPRTLLARHRTMHAVLEWSFDNLSALERDLLLGLAIFEGESAMEAIRAVIPDTGVSTGALAETLSSLVNKSLVATKIAAAGLFYYLLDTTRAFALERLRETGKLPEISQRHAYFVLETLQRIESDRNVSRAADLLDARRRELGNLRTALDWAYESQAAEPFKLALSAAAARILLDLSLVEQCRRRVVQALQSMERSQTQDLALEMRLKALFAVASFYTPGPIAETVATLERVAEITEHLDNPEYRAIALWGLWSVSIFRNEPDRALGFAQQFRNIRSDLPEAVRELLFDRMTGTALHQRGQQPQARDCLERVSNRFEPAVHGWSVIGLHVDHGLMARIYLARIFWLQGEFERAIRTCQDSVEALGAQGHALAQCHALFEVALPLNYMIGDLEAAKANLALLQELAAKHGLSIFQAGATWADRAFAAIQQKTDLSACKAAARDLQACRYEAQYPWLSSIMAAEALRRGDTDAGIEWISPCLQTQDDGWWLAELQRLQGELAAAGRAPADREVALAHFQRAIETARRQGALTLELRATVSRISLDRGFRPQADLKNELDGVLARFRQPSGTADLVAAHRLSEELAGS
jgi:predicted ATPase/DNA-binding winged helix-turn-helix (wHTH) protein